MPVLLFRVETHDSFTKFMMCCCCCAADHTVAMQKNEHLKENRVLLLRCIKQLRPKVREEELLPTSLCQESLMLACFHVRGKLDTYCSLYKKQTPTGRIE